MEPIVEPPYFEYPLELTDEHRRKLIEDKLARAVFHHNRMLRDPNRHPVNTSLEKKREKLRC